MRRSLEIVFFASLIAGCSSDAEAPAFAQSEETCGAQNLGYWAAEELSVTGLASNALHHKDGLLYVVESRDNTISTWDIELEQYSPFADLGNDQNPYDLFVGSGVVWVTNYIGRTVSQITQGGENVDAWAAPSFRNPSGVAEFARHLWVTDVNYISPSQGFGPSTVVKRNLESDEEEIIEMSFLNTQFADVFEFGSEEVLVLTSTGAVQFVDRKAMATSSGAVDVIASDGTMRTVEFPVPSPQRSGALSRPAQPPGSKYLYFTSATAPEIYKLDVETLTWVRGPEDPIVLYESEEDTLHHISAGPDGMLYVTAFNTDEIWRVDTRCDEVLAEPVKVGRSSLLEGPHMIQVVDAPEGGVDAYYLLSLSNRLGRVKFRPSQN
jgi:hypothetical protein